MKRIIQIIKQRVPFTYAKLTAMPHHNDEDGKASQIIYIYFMLHNFQYLYVPYIFDIFSPLKLIILAGLPTTTALSGISLVTTQLAPIITLFPKQTFPITFEPANNIQWSPMTGDPFP